MTNLKIGIQTRSLRQPLRTALHTAARLGATGVEIDLRTELPPAGISQTGLRELLKMLGDLSLRVSAAAFPTRHGYDEPHDLERRIMATQTAMHFAAKLGTDVLINRVGSLPAEDDDHHRNQFIEALTMLGAHGDRVGVRIAAQTLGEGPDELSQLIQSLPDHTLGIDLFPSGLIAAGHSVHEAVELLGPHIVHVHACDAVRDGSSGRSVTTELGRGMAEIPELIGRLTEFDYRGWFTVVGRDSASPIEEIENSVAFLRAL